MTVVPHLYAEASLSVIRNSGYRVVEIRMIEVKRSKL
jgi:hypothetical protein